MGEEVRITDYDVTGGDDVARVMEWEAGLPNVADLPPLSQFLISPDLASAFSITPEPHRSMIDVDRASRNTISELRVQSQPRLLNKLRDFRSGSDDREEEMVVEGDETVTVDLTGDGSPSRKIRRVDRGGAGAEARIRLVWTPQLHKRFVEVVAHLGLKKAVPKTVMQLMNVEGLSRENVASHLQKYRLYVKRMQGLSTEGSSPSDHLFASTPGSKSLQIVPGILGDGGGGYHHGLDYHNSDPYNMMMQPKEWSGNDIGSVSRHQNCMTPNHN